MKEKGRVMGEKSKERNDSKTIREGRKFKQEGDGEGKREDWRSRAQAGTSQQELHCRVISEASLAQVLPIPLLLSQADSAVIC